MYLFLSVYMSSLDIPIRIAMRRYGRYHEKQADLYAVERGYGESLKNSLIRAYCKSLDNLWPSWLEQDMTSEHPTMQERLDYINEAIENRQTGGAEPPLAELKVLKIDVPADPEDEGVEEFDIEKTKEMELTTPLLIKEENKKED